MNEKNRLDNTRNAQKHIEQVMLKYYPHQIVSHHCVICYSKEFLLHFFQSAEAAEIYTCMYFVFVDFFFAFSDGWTFFTLHVLIFAGATQFKEKHIYLVNISTTII